MGDETKIQWCDHTFNAWIGCEKISPGCKHCYAAVDTYARVRATANQQARNTRKAVRLTMNGQTLPLADWSEICGIKEGTIRFRLSKGWAHEAALTTPVRQALREARR